MFFVIEIERRIIYNKQYQIEIIAWEQAVQYIQQETMCANDIG